MTEDNLERTRFAGNREGGLNSSLDLFSAEHLLGTLKKENFCVSVGGLDSVSQWMIEDRKTLLPAALQGALDGLRERQTTEQSVSVESLRNGLLLVEVEKEAGSGYILGGQLAIPQGRFPNGAIPRIEWMFVAHCGLLTILRQSEQTAVLRSAGRTATSAPTSTRR